MIFNSIDFLFYFSLFFFLYWFVFNKSLQLQNLLILTGSYLFYAWWDWRFLFLLAGNSILNFFLGIFIQNAEDALKRKLFLYLGLLLGVGELLFFKYFNFFINSFNDILMSLNIQSNLHTLSIILPLGISFYTFRMMSYLLDIHKRKIMPTKNWLVFSGYAAFFPSLMSGPIDKARMFIPQLEKKRVFEYNQAADGLRQILWGLFKKVVVANNCATFVNAIFSNYQDLSASSLLLGSFFYAFQIYADFSGYSDMAIGISRLLGFSITKNFDFPYFSQNIVEFWRKWHISLTSWVTEYVFTPLTIAFRDYGKTGLILAVLINLTIIGIWHGANWTFVLFGVMHGCYFIPFILKGTLNKKKKTIKGRYFLSFREILNITATFTLVMLTLVLFRADNITQAFDYLKRLFSISLLSKPDILAMKIGMSVLIPSFFVFMLGLVEWIQKSKDHGLQIENVRYVLVRWAFYFCIMFTIFYYQGAEQQFIYFKF
jgi:alginate O-acetyltransferase complex protein AlgI